MAQSKNWLFTLNNPREHETILLQSLVADDQSVSYLVYQLEEGEDTGTPHYQGYLQLTARKRLTQVKLLLGPRANIRRADGTAEQNKKYCTKLATRKEGPWEFGEMTTKGKRNDISAFVEAMREMPLTDAEILEHHPQILAKYPRFVATARRLTAESRLTDPPFAARPGWQESLLGQLIVEPHPRKVMWYYDEVGGVGKSLFSRRFRDEHGGRPYVVTGGKHADIQYGYARQPVVFFDWPRSGEEAFPYGVVEAFKNGYFLNTKYESTPVYFNSPHVVVFANFSPDRSKLSADRWDIHVIDNSLL